MFYLLFPAEAAQQGECLAEMAVCVLSDEFAESYLRFVLLRCDAFVVVV